MAEENLPTRVRRRSEGPRFEELKLLNPHGAEYWSARDLQPLLGYNQWRTFEKAIDKAITSCQQSGNDPEHHFARARKMVSLGSGSEQIKSRKRIARRENLLDHMGTTELAANQFRMTQAREKLAQEAIHGQQRAIDTHHQVGKEVREAIRRIGGTMPENLPPAEDIRQVQKRLKSHTPPLELPAPDAKDLTEQERQQPPLG